MVSFAERLAELRKTRNIEQKEMAIFLKLNTRTYQHYEYGHVTPNATMLIKLADFFDVSVDYLLGRSDVRERR